MNEKTIKYLANHRINEVITEGINEILTSHPPNPWRSFTNTFNSNMTSNFNVNSVKASIKIGKDSKTTFVLTLNMQFKNQNSDFKIKINCSGFETNESSELNSVIFAPFDVSQKNEKLIEKVKEIENALGTIFCNRDLHKHSNWMSVLKEFKAGQKILSVFFGPSLVWLHYEFVSKFEKKSFNEYLQNIGILQQINDNSSTVYYHFFVSNKGIHKSSKDVFFTIQGFSDYENHKTAFEFIILAKNELESNKAFAGKIVFHSGAIVSPFESLTDSIKFLNDLCLKFPKRDHVKMAIDINGSENFDLEGLKYVIDLVKKPMTEEEYEDFLIKTVGDRKFISTLIDPFPLTQHFSWHRFNKKLKEKNFSFKFSTKFYENYDPEIFEKIVVEKYPTIKPDIMTKIIENVVVVKEQWMKMNTFDDFLALSGKLHEFGKTGNVKSVVCGPENHMSLNHYYAKFARFLGTDMVVSARDMGMFNEIWNEKVKLWFD